VDTVSDDRKGQALAGCRRLLEKPEIRMDTEEQYNKLLKLVC
jgi:hypothetical protein